MKDSDVYQAKMRNDSVIDRSVPHRLRYTDLSCSEKVTNCDVEKVVL